MPKTPDVEISDKATAETGPVPVKHGPVVLGSDPATPLNFPQHWQGGVSGVLMLDALAGIAPSASIDFIVTYARSVHMAEIKVTDDDELSLRSLETQRLLDPVTREFVLNDESVRSPWVDAQPRTTVPVTGTVRITGVPYAPAISTVAVRSTVPGGHPVGTVDFAEDGEGREPDRASDVRQYQRVAKAVRKFLKDAR